MREEKKRSEGKKKEGQNAPFIRTDLGRVNRGVSDCVDKEFVFAVNVG